MAPLLEKDTLAIVGGLKARRLLEGYRGAEPVNRGKLTGTLPAFSSLVMELEGRIDSIDINPLPCSAGGCVCGGCPHHPRRMIGAPCPIGASPGQAKLRNVKARYF
jgi:hypothetical protein